MSLMTLTRWMLAPPGFFGSGWPSETCHFIAVNHSGAFRQGFGELARRAAARRLNTHLDEYQPINDAGTGDRLNHPNILQLTYPRPATKARDTLYQRIVPGFLWALTSCRRLRTGLR
jgi:hypothetical protein